MPFNGSGTYTPAAAPNFPAVAGESISSEYYNNVINDIATALSMCLTRDNQGKPSAAINWNSQLLGNVSNLGVGVTTPTLAFELMTSSDVMGSIYSSNVTSAEFYFGSAVVKGVFGSHFAVPTVYIGSETSHDVAIVSNGVERLIITAAGLIEDANGFELGWKTLPRSTTATTASLADKGKVIAISAAMAIPSAIFAAGDSFSIYNNSASSVAITQGGGLTLRLGGTTSTGSRTLAARGLVTVWFNTANEAIIQGAGLS